MTNELYLIKNLMIDCAEMGAAQCLKTLQPKSDDLTQRQAYEKFGEAWVKKCVQMGIVQKQRKGTAKNSPVYYSKAELLTVRNAEKASRLGVFENTNL